MRGILTLLFFILLQSVWAQNYVGTDFRVAFLKNIDPLFNGDPTFEIVVDAQEDVDVTVSYGQPGDAYFLEQSATLIAGQLNSFVFNTGQFLNQEQLNIQETRSFHVVATGDVKVYGYHNRVYFSEASSVLPTSSLGTDYFVMAYNDNNGTYPSIFNVIATEDNTAITVVPTSGTVFGGSGDPFELNLDAGEVISISSGSDLTGTRVTSEPDKPVAVFGGQQQGLVGQNCGADSHLYDQVLPTSELGTIYSVIPIEGGDGNLFRILATEDNTSVFAGCELLTTLNQGEFFQEIFDEPEIITSNEPIAVAAFTLSNECSGLNTGDPNMRMLLPLESASTDLQFAVETDIVAQLQLTYVHLVMPTDEIGSLQVNGNGISNWESFDTSPVLSYARVELEDITTLLTIESDSPFWSEFVGLSQYDGMTLNLGATAVMDVPDINSDLVDLGPDFPLCPGETAILDPGLGTTGTWQDGTISETYLVEGPGTYSVQIEGACGTGFDEVVVSEGILPQLELEDSYSICNGQSIEIGVESESSTQYLWNTGADTSLISVSAPGIYSLTATSGDGCESESETEVVFSESPELELKAPEFLCEGESATLFAEGDQGSFQWNDGSSGSSLIVSEPGTYSVSLTNAEGCSTEAQVNISGLLPPIVLPFDTTFCSGESLRITLNSPNAEISWPGLSNSEFININDSGEYEYVAENQCGIESGVLELVADDCSCPTYVPNAFSPNGDGLNDIFKPEINCPVDNYKLVIFNRWGREVFRSEDPNTNWNGVYFDGGDYLSPGGVYFYVIQFDNALKSLTETMEFSGSLTLLR